MKMQSPVKKISFAGKENAPFDIDAPVTEATYSKTEKVHKVDVSALQAENALLKLELAKMKKGSVTTVAPTIKLEEMDEPLLQDNPQRFVLFPIKYHEVSLASPTR